MRKNKIFDHKKEHEAIMIYIIPVLLRSPTSVWRSYTKVKITLSRHPFAPINACLNKDSWLKSLREMRSSLFRTISIINTNKK